MTLLILSDSHGRADNILRAYERNRQAAEILFLGDGLNDVQRVGFDGKVPICVRGNCDAGGVFSFSDVPAERILSFGEYNILMLHGHNYGVKSSLERAIARAAEKGADLLLYGHTHIRRDVYLPEGTEIGDVRLVKPLRVFNPGSIGSPRNGGYSFGLITIRSKDILTSHGEI
ncbi:MAG: YfcE family phosphodiesterase [Clostridia bacterium]|nr:YfcE family phosphodiesterase [Clostridia bacterium]